MNNTLSQWTCNSSKNYLDCVNNFINDTNIFSIFRNGQFDGYTSILEHIDYHGGLSYFNWIKNKNLNLEDNLFLAQKNDLIGNPKVYNYDSYSINPTTLRYLKYAIQIKEIFGELPNANYIEVGAGYGGLTRIMNEFYNFNSINLFDLPEVLLLQEKYLSHYEIKINKCNILENFEVPKDTIFVSNYALSELNKETRKLYIDKILSKCKYIFIASNIRELKHELSNFNLSIDLDCFDDTELLIIKN